MTPNTLLSQDPVAAARAMLGWTLTSNIDGLTTSGIIVETEAYRALDDPAAHGYRNRTKRNAPIWEDAGTIYVYLTYGMYHLMNIVTGPRDTGWVVLVRALEPTEGLDIMMDRRNVTKQRQATSGPGKLTQALGVSLAQTGSVLGNELMLTPPLAALDDNMIESSVRIGISQGKDLPWRFYIRDNPYVSKP